METLANDVLLIYILILIVSILNLIIIGFGSETTWYSNLNTQLIDQWIIRSLLIVVIITSYIALIILSINCTATNIPSLFLINMLLFLGWSTIFYYYEDIGASLWLLFVLFSYSFWLFMYVWRFSTLASIFLIPLLCLEVYILYSSIHLASTNNIIL